MFYSHEILSSRQYGVATIWIVATVGIKASTRKINKKAILDVNVPKACDTIVHPPGAPIALRLQGNLLYGVSRVYDQQCGYMLGDVERVRHQLRTFVNAGGNLNALDPNAGKARRDQLLLNDDPNFDLTIHLPALYFDEEENLFSFLPSLNQLTGKTSSQMSPVGSGASSSGRGSLLGGFDWPQSSLGGSVHLPSPFGHGSMSLPKPHDEPMPLIEDDVLFPFEDIGLEVDADGNIIQVTQELELPPLTIPSASVQQQPGQASIEEAPHQQLPVGDREDIIMNLEDNILPDAASFSARRQAAGAIQDQFEVPSPPRRRRGRKVIAEDDATRISRDDFQSWSTNYLRNMAAARKPTLAVTAYKAKQNAENLVFGLGLASIGLPTGIPGAAHPLADFFAGATLRRSILGSDADQEQEEQRGQRRSSSEAFGEEEGRRVRPRWDDDRQEFGRADNDDQMLFPEDELLEVGREHGSALSEGLSSAPWNRPPSATRGSSVHSKTVPATLSNTGRQVSSPLVGRGSAIADIVRLSDNAAGGLESDGCQPNFEPSFPSSDHQAPFGDIPGFEASQAMRDALNREGNKFLSFVGGVAAERGVTRTPEDEQTNCRWVDFSDLFEEADNTKATAAQAFFHVLTLVTRGAFKVEQDEEDMQPFGNIRLGVKTLPRFTEEQEQAAGEAGDEQTQTEPQDLVQGVTGGSHYQYSQDRDDMSDIYDA